MSNQESELNENLATPLPRPKRWRWIFLCLCFFICGLFLGPILAKEIIGHRGHPDLEERTKRVVEHMRSELNLTDEQTQKVYTISKERFSELEGTMRKNFDRMNSEIRSVLTAEQIVKYDEWMKNKLERFPGPPK
ncbi:MAG: hypothetical protein WC980_06090 [Candidatus Brocadiia bacterium]